MSPVTVVAHIQKMNTEASPNSFNFFDGILEVIDYLRATEHDDTTTKTDVIDSVRMRMSCLVPRVLANTNCNSLTILGWKTDKFEM